MGQQNVWVDWPCATFPWYRVLAAAEWKVAAAAAEVAAVVGAEDHEGVVPDPFLLEAVDDVGELIIKRRQHPGQPLAALIRDL